MFPVKFDRKYLRVPLFVRRGERLSLQIEAFATAITAVTAIMTELSEIRRPDDLAKAMNEELLQAPSIDFPIPLQLWLNWLVLRSGLPVVVVQPHVLCDYREEWIPFQALGGA